MGLAESAVILLGIGIISSKFGAGVGLSELGAGVQSLVSAPLTGTGLGLSSFAGGLRDVFETFGDLGRGLSTLFQAIPAGPPGAGGGAFPSPSPEPDPSPSPWDPWGGGGGGVRNLVVTSGGDYSALLPGGGGNVPSGGTEGGLPSYIPPPTKPKYLDRSVSMVDERNRPVMM